MWRNRENRGTLPMPRSFRGCLSDWQVLMEIDLAQVQRWAEEAGHIALHYFNHVAAERKADRTLVSQADREVETFLVRHIQEAYPDHGIIGEEGARETGGEWLWAIDPIDGTRAFLSGLPVWAISLGLLHDGLPVWGLLYLPITGDFYYTEDSGAFWNGQLIRCRPPEPWEASSLLCVPSNSHRRYDLFAFPGITRALGSTAVHIALVARGVAVGALTGHTHIWDTAGALPILERAGGAVSYLSGRPFDPAALLDGRKAPEPILAAHPEVIERLRAAIRWRKA